MKSKRTNLGDVKYLVRWGLLERKNIDLTNLADKIGISYTSLVTQARYSTPSIHAALGMAKECKCSIEYLLGLTEDRTPPERYDLNIRLGEILSEKGFSLYALQKASGIHQQTIANYARHKYVPTTKRIILIADALGVSVDYVLGLTDTLYWGDEKRKCKVKMCSKRAAKNEACDKLKEIAELNGIETVGELARCLDTEQSLLKKKFDANNLTESDIRKYANLLGYEAKLTFISEDDGKEI